MQKIETVFLRDPAKPKYVTREVNPNCKWVVDGEGWATRKWDGTCCLIRDSVFYRRHEWDKSKGEPPTGWIHHTFDPAQRSGHGWVPVTVHPADRLHMEGYNNSTAPAADAPRWLPDGTYELCGPNVQKNPEGLDRLMLVRHGAEQYPDVPRDFDGLAAWLAPLNIEGLVFYHPDGRMAKIKRRDFPTQKQA